MFDLNVNDSAHELSIDSNCDEVSDHRPRHQLLLSTTPRRQDSGTSISSVLNVADDAPGENIGDNTGESCCKFEGRELKSVRSVELITRQLFPVKGDEMEKMSDEIQSRWLNLSVSGGGESRMMRGFEDRKAVPVPAEEVPVTRMKKSRRGPRSRSSQYRGVTFYRRTGRWESHIWDCGKQVYLGGFDTAHAAARAYDRAAVKFRGPDADINFTATDYEDDLKQTKDMTKEEFVQILRHQSNGLTRGSSKYRGVTLHKNGRWGTQMDQFLGKKACNEAAVECNAPITEKNLKPGTYGGNFSLANNNQESADTHHNLDLGLWISPPSNSQRGNNSARDMRLLDPSYHLSGAKRTKVEGFDPAPYGRETSHYIPSWPVNHSGLAPSYELTAMKNMEARVVPSHGISNWEWQTNNLGVVNPLPLFSAAAASSGFSSTTWKFQPPSYQ
ncbi:AP2-like ethylene-responsive transcription factor TOE2 [Heracleum sosnowskyi]|uniref:AP2-like ethylene-responsive transcription factor TOE2 n=1 Tax=Heracleum sosnowskyi TaxID=360622 RepID=A0AAD8GUA5_9APIA|nr:AP2-like ethylene-responsive transcription factor TOE2 [Heracleum sosnowskyi]